MMVLPILWNAKWRLAPRPRTCWAELLLRPRRQVVRSEFAVTTR